MGTPSITAPSGTITSQPTVLAGAYTRAVPTDALGPLELVEVDLTTHETSHAGELTLWTATLKIPASGVLADTFSIDLPVLAWTNRAYCWRFRLRDSLGTWSSWTSRGTFTLDVADPVLSTQRPPEAAATLLSMTGFRVSATYSDGEGSPPSRISFEVVAQVAAEAWDEATYDPDTNVWTYDGPPRDWDGSRVTCRYGGPALTEGSTYLWRMAATSPFGATTGYVGGQFTLVDRTVPGTGPVETVSTIWREIWRTTVIPKPVGVWYDSADPGNLRVIDRQNKNLTVLSQTDLSVVSEDYLGGIVAYPAGLSGDPADNTKFWLLRAPWTQGAGLSGNRLVCLARSGFGIVHNFTIADGRWTAIKVSAAYAYAANWDDGKIYQFNKATGAVVNSFTITYESVVQTQPTGIMVDGTDLYYFFYNGDGQTRRFLKAAESAPGTILSATSTEGTFLLGGEMDTTTHTELYGDTDTDNLTAKFTLREVQYSDGTAATRLRVTKTSYGDA